MTFGEAPRKAGRPRSLYIDRARVIRGSTPESGVNRRVVIVPETKGKTVCKAALISNCTSKHLVELERTPHVSSPTTVSHP